MLRKLALLGSALALNPRFMLAADHGGGTGGGAPLTLEQRLTAAQNDLATARASVTSLTTERDTAARERDEARAENTRLTEQFNSAAESATTAQRERDEARTQLATATAERDTARIQLGASNSNVARLEALCRLKGINPQNAVPPVETPQEKVSVKHFDERMKSAATPAARAAIVAEFEAAVKSGKVA